MIYRVLGGNHSHILVVTWVAPPTSTRWRAEDLSSEGPRKGKLKRRRGRDRIGVREEKRREKRKKKARRENNEWFVLLAFVLTFSRFLLKIGGYHGANLFLTASYLTNGDTSLLVLIVAL